MSTTLQLNACDSERKESEDNAQPMVLPEPAANLKVLRFAKSERLLHWAKHHYRRWYREHHEVVAKHPHDTAAP
jgi:hypothetical protein